jgi:hypothetical protein
MTDRITRGAMLEGREGIVWYCRECSGPDGTVGGHIYASAHGYDADAMNAILDVEVASHLEVVHGVAPVLADIYVETDDGLAHAFRPGAMVARCGAGFGTGGRGAWEPTCIDCGADDGDGDGEDVDDITLTEHDWSDRADAIRAWFD